MDFEIEFKKVPLYLLPKLDLSDPQYEVILERLNAYAEIFLARRNTSGLKLLVALTESNINKSARREYQHLEFLILGSSTLNFFRGIFKLSLDSRYHVGTLIAGDPVYGFLSGLLLRLTKFRNSNLQLQFHGDVYSKASIRGVKSFIRFMIVRVSLRLADSVRVVSNFQILELCDLARANTKFIVAPIPLDYAKIPINPQIKRSGIGFIGRLHPERGTREFVSIVQELRSRGIFEPIFVIGDGKDKNFMISELRKFNLLSGVNFLGNIGANELRNKYSVLKVILSCAVTEGYGLTLREGVISGAEVVARKSAGSVEALSHFQENLYLYEDVEDALRLIVQALGSVSDQYSNLERINIQKTFERTSISEWVSSW